MSFNRFLRRALAVALCICVPLSLAGCSSGEDTFSAAVDGVPDTLDPQLADSAVESIVAVNLFEGLFRLNAEGAAVPAACESYVVSADGLTWTFTLREDIFYNDGDEETPATPVTADDFVFALQRLFTGGGSPYRAAFAGIAGAAEVAAGQPATALGVAAVGDRTLIIRLAAPDEGLPLKLCCPGAMPCSRAFYEASEGTYGLQPETVLANGAFRLSLWSSENGVTLRRVTPGEGLVNRVRLLPAAPDSTPADRFAAGETDGEFITGLSADGADAYCVQTQTLLINCREKQLANAGVRAGLAGVLYRAVAALDETVLPAAFWEGRATAGGLVPDSVTFGTAGWRSLAGSLLNTALPEDPVASYRQGLAESGATKLGGITVLVPDTPAWRSLYAQISLAWQQQLSAFFSVQYLPESDIAAAVASGSYQLAFVSRSALQDDVGAELAWYMAVTGYADAAVADLLAQAAVGGTSAAAADALRTAETQLLCAWPAVPIVTVAGYYALRADCTGVAASPFGPLLDFAAARWLPQE